MNVLSLIGQKHTLFANDFDKHEDELGKIIPDNSFLVIGGAGSIGQAVTKEIFKRNPKILHVVDISENNLVELVRDARSTIGYVSTIILKSDGFFVNRLRTKCFGLFGVTQEILRYENLGIDNCKHLETVCPNGLVFEDQKKLLNDRRHEPVKIAFITSYFYSWNSLEELLEGFNDISLTNIVGLHLVGELSTTQKSIMKPTQNIVVHQGTILNKEISTLMEKIDISLAAFNIDFPYYLTGKPSINKMIKYALKMRKVSKQKIRNVRMLKIDKCQLLQRFYCDLLSADLKYKIQTTTSNATI